MEYTKEDVGMFLRQGRTALELTQEDVAEAMDCNATYYGNLDVASIIPAWDYSSEWSLICTCPWINSWKEKKLSGRILISSFSGL